ncbi:hypothetical protein I7I53_01273 [Histoplasma capsulatum var. duboisii H88]|uniref:Uncharacterized protein n=1 Tax=Ajellomyces capsulatus (strain H88) TaxID=544711 RepID=A0A8A1LHM6_AJEC8|nr:hypothetical protein I7I53_01273 [Histoplasma capsulatum var. duboisii H88]
MINFKVASHLCLNIYIYIHDLQILHLYLSFSSPPRRDARPTKSYSEIRQGWCTTSKLEIINEES